MCPTVLYLSEFKRERLLDLHDHSDKYHSKEKEELSRTKQAFDRRLFFNKEERKRVFSEDSDDEFDDLEEFGDNRRNL